MTYAKQKSVKPVKPFMLVIARDTTHAALLLDLLENQLFDGRYRGKVIQVDSSRSGAAEEEMVTRLLAVEGFGEPTEIVIHVNMLKEGWDVTNLYTIVQLRAANAKTLVEQTIGRGLRLPYGKRTGVDAVDRLSIVAHDRFQEIVDEANKEDSLLRKIKLVEWDFKADEPKESVTIKSTLDTILTRTEVVSGSSPDVNGNYLHKESNLTFYSDSERRVAEVAWQVIKGYQHKPAEAPTSKELLTPDIQQKIVRQVSERLTGEQQSLLEKTEKRNLVEVVEKTTQFVVAQTIDIPRIVVVPKGEVSSRLPSFYVGYGQLKLATIKS